MEPMLRGSTRGECPRSGRLGWAPSTALTEPMRRRIRERPVDRRAAIYAG